LIEGIIKTGSMLNYCLSQALISVMLATWGLPPYMSPYFDTLDLGLLPYTSWVKLGEGPCASNKGPPKKRGKGRPWEAAFPRLLRQKWSDQSRKWSILSAAYSSDILEAVMKQSQQRLPLGNVNVTLHRTLANILNCNCRSYLGTPFHPSNVKFVCMYIWTRSVSFCGQFLYCDKKQSAVLLIQRGDFLSFFATKIQLSYGLRWT
jgi:hypothetical protein